LRVVTEEELKRNEEELKRKESQDAPVTDSSPSSSSDTELPPLPPEMPHITQPVRPQMVQMASNQFNNVNRMTPATGSPMQWLDYWCMVGPRGQVNNNMNINWNGHFNNNAVIFPHQ